MEKYTMFKNFMHNELGITKEDIKEWTQEAVKQTADNYIKHQMVNPINDKIIAIAIGERWGTYHRDIRKVVAKLINDKLEITLKGKQ